MTMGGMRPLPYRAPPTGPTNTTSDTMTTTTREPDRGDAELVLKLYDLRRESEMRKARNFIGGFEPTSVEDVAAVLSYEHPENAHFRQATSYWGMVADFAVRGMLHPEMFAAHCGEALWTYAKFEPFLPQIRERFSPIFMANIEAAVRCHPAVEARLAQIREIRAKLAAMEAQAEAAKPTRKAAKKKGKR
jgi:hypothetical protein